MTRPGILLYIKVRVKSDKVRFTIPVVLPLFLVTSIVSYTEDLALLLGGIPALRKLESMSGMNAAAMLTMARKLVRGMMTEGELDVDIDAMHDGKKVKVRIKLI